jgi:hypothetical protein
VTVRNHVTLPLLVPVAKRTASATAATNLVIWQKIAPPKVPLRAKNATSVVVWATLPATALQVLVEWEVACVVAMVVVVVVMEEATAEDSAKVLSSATPAVASATCRATALKAKSATTVSPSYQKRLTFYCGG